MTCIILHATDTLLIVLMDFGASRLATEAKFGKMAKKQRPEPSTDGGKIPSADMMGEGGMGGRKSGQRDCRRG